MVSEEESLIRDTIRGFSRAIILWLIHKKPLSGYRVIKEMQRLTGQRFTVGVIYPILYELEEKGFITGRWQEKGRKRIKYYSITEEGTKILESLRENLEGPIKGVLRHLLGEAER